MKGFFVLDNGHTAAPRRQKCFLSEQVEDQERPPSRDEDVQNALDNFVSVINFEPQN